MQIKICNNKCRCINLIWYILVLRWFLFNCSLAVREELMTYERKGLILSYRRRNKLALKTPRGIHLLQDGKDKWNRPRHPNATTIKKNMLLFHYPLRSLRFYYFIICTRKTLETRVCPNRTRYINNNKILYQVNCVQLLHVISDS